MIPADNSPESPKTPDPSTALAASDVAGQNGVNERKYGIWPFDGPQPYELTPEELESLRELWDEEDEKGAAAGIREILEGHGVSSEELFRRLEQVVRDNG